MFNKEKILTDCLEKNIIKFDIACDKAFIFTLSDLHIGLGNLEYVKDIVEFILSIKNAYVVIGGDLVNNTTKNSLGCVLEEYATGQEQIKLAVEVLKPLADNNRIIAIVDSGNHEKRTENEVYISITQIIATMLGITNKYVKEFCIGYINVNKNCYIYANTHKHRLTKNYYSFFNADCLVLEHTHDYSCEEKMIMFHNKYTKKTSLRSSFIINNGSALAFPSYAKINGYAPQQIGSFVIELNGKDRNISVWKDVDLYNAINGGYMKHG